MKQTIIAMLEGANSLFPASPYLCDKVEGAWKSTSFAEALGISRALCAAFQKHGVRGNVAILAEGRSSWVLSELAVFLNHGTTVPLSIKLQAEEIPYRINHAKVSLLVISRLSADKVLEVWSQYDHPVKVLCLDEEQDLLDKIASVTGTRVGEGVLKFSELVSEGLELLKDPENKARIDALQSGVEEEFPATIGYTSGTTGNPKGITLAQRSYFCNVRDSLAGFDIKRGVRMFVILPIDHAYAHTIALYAPLIKELSIWFVDARGGAVGIARNILPNMNECNPDMMLSVPSLTSSFMTKIIGGVRQKGGLAWSLFNAGLRARIFMNGNLYDRPAWYKRIVPFFPAAVAELIVFRKIRAMFGTSFTYTISGGAMLEYKQQEFFKAVGISVYQGYGLSEAGPVVSTNSAGYHKLGSSGMVLPNVECKIVNAQGDELPAGQKGEILLRTGGMMLGYYENPEETAKTIVDGWLRTGDLGYMDDDRYLFVVGREKALLIMEDGEKYSPEEIEEALVACSGGRIVQSMLWCDHRKYVTALITVDREELVRKTGKDPDKILAQIMNDFDAFRKDPNYRDKFPKHWLPKTFVIVPEPFSESNGMINSTLKMVRRTITARYQAEIDFMYEGEGTIPNNSKNKENLKIVLGRSLELA